MKILQKIFQKILQWCGMIVCAIISTPFAMIFGVARMWLILFDHPSTRRTVYKLLKFGEGYITGFDGDVVVCTKKSNVIYEAHYDLFANIPKAVKKMVVNAWWVEDNRLWVKVLVDDKLMDKLANELAEKEDSHGDV